MNSKSVTALLVVLHFIVSGCSQPRQYRVLVPLRVPLDLNETCYVGHFTTLRNGGLQNAENDRQIREAVAERLRVEGVFADVLLEETGQYKYIVVGNAGAQQISFAEHYVDQTELRYPGQEKRKVWKRERENNAPWTVMKFDLLDARTGEVVYSLSVQSRDRSYGCVIQFAQKLRKAVP